MANSYEILLSIAGKLNPSLTQAATSASKAVGGIGNNAQDATRSLNNLGANGSRMDKLKTSLTEVKLAFGAVGVMAADYLKGAVDSAVKSQKVTANLEATIKSTGGAAGMTAKQVEDMAGGFAKTTLFGGDAIKTGDAMLLTFTNIGKDVLPGATDAMLNMAQKMGTDPVASAVQLGKALNDPSKGLTALTRVGVTFTDQQKKQIESMQKAGNIAGAQKIILKELSTEFGGQATAATKTYDGQLQMMNKSLAGVKKSIGIAVLPYLQMMVEKIQGIITPIADFIQKNSQLVAVILSATTAFGLFVGGAGLVQKVLSILGPVASGLGTTIGGMMLPVAAIIAVIALLGVAYAKNFMGMKTAVDGFINGSMKILMQVFNQVKAWFIANLPTIKTTFKAVFDGITSAIKSVIAFLEPIFMPVFRNVHQWFITNLPGIKAAFEIAFKKVVEVAGGLWSYFQSNLLPIIMRLVNTVMANLPMIQDIFANVFAIIGNVLGIAWIAIKKIWDILVWLYNFISPTFPLIGAIIKTAFDIVIGVVESVIGTFTKLVDIITKAVGWLTNWNGTPAKSKSLDVSQNTTSGGMQAARKMAAGGIVRHRSGGIMANIGEGSYDEAVIPLKPGGGIGNGGGSPITWSPQIIIQGNASKDDVRQALSDSQRDFEQKMRIYEANKKRVSFA